jgi:hypothetical protein
MTTPSGSEESDDQERPPGPQAAPGAGPRVRRHTGPDEPAGRWALPDSERDEVWGDDPADAGERLRRDVPPHHGG